MVSADAYPSRTAVDRDGGINNLQRFMKHNVRQPTNPATMADDEPTPEREYAGPGLEHVLPPSAPRPNSSVAGETLGAMHRPTDTRKYPAAHEPGMPAGWTSAANPNAAAV